MNKLNIRLLGTMSSDDAQLIDFSIDIGGALKTLFKGRVDSPQFVEWLKKNEKQIRLCDFPVDNLANKSIAEKIASFYENVDVDNDELVDAMFDYRASHCLRFASRGTDFPEIYLGKSEAGHEISIFNEHEQWQYFFDIDDFFHQLSR